MKYNSEIHHRHTLRLPDFNYASNGAYFITICVQNHECLLGEISNGQIILNSAGQMVSEILQQIPGNYPGNDIDEFIVMPNHIHVIIFIVGKQSPVLPLPDIVQRIKSLTTKKYCDGVIQSNWIPYNGRLWQRNYYERIIRDEKELNYIRNYIRNNPISWEQNPVFTGELL